MAETPDTSPDALAQTLDGLLLPLGGRTALAAQHFTGDKAAIHLRADEVFPAASLAKLPIAVELMRRIGADLANSRRWSEWKRGAEFKAIRDKSGAARR